METKKAPTSAATLTGAGIETFPGSNSDLILAQKVFNRLIEIWGQEHGYALEVKPKSAGDVVA